MNSARLAEIEQWTRDIYSGSGWQSEAITELIAEVRLLQEVPVPRLEAEIVRLRALLAAHSLAGIDPTRPF